MLETVQLLAAATNALRGHSLDFLKDFVRRLTPTRTDPSHEELTRIAEHLGQITQRLEGVADEINRVSDSIIFVAKYRRSLEAEGHLELAAKSTRAGVFDIGLQQLGKAETLDPSNWGVWMGYASFRVLLAISNKTDEQVEHLLTSIPHALEVEVDRAAKLLQATKNLTASQKSAILYQILEISVACGNYQLANELVESIASLILSSGTLRLENAQRYLLPLIIATKGGAGPMLSSAIKAIRTEFMARISEHIRNFNHDVLKLYYIKDVSFDTLITCSVNILSQSDIYLASSIQDTVKEFRSTYVDILKRKSDIEKALSEHDLIHVSVYGAGISPLMWFDCSSIITIIILPVAAALLTHFHRWVTWFVATSFLALLYSTVLWIRKRPTRVFRRRQLPYLLEELQNLWLEYKESIEALYARLNEVAPELFSLESKQLPVWHERLYERERLEHLLIQ